MKSKLIIVLVIGILFFLHRSNPSFDDHVSFIRSEYLQKSSKTKEPDEKLRNGLDYNDFMILSLTQEKGKLSLITVGAATQNRIHLSRTGRRCSPR